MQFVKKTALFAYNVLLCVLWPVFFLYYYCRSRTDGKYRGNYRARLGLELPGLLKAGPKRIWLHALSVGEVLSSVPLIIAIKKQRPETDVVVSTATETGMAIARQRLAGCVSGFFFMPNDFPWAAHAVTGKIHPSLFILIETDLWPNLLHRLKEKSVPTVLVNGRISPRSFRKYSRLHSLAEIMFDGLDLVFTQTEQDKKRFESLGRPPDKVIAAGNLKFESLPQKATESEVRLLRQEIGLETGRPVWIAGSTHAGEEEIVLRVHKELMSHFEDPLVIVVPRDIRRGAEVEALCAGCGFTAGVRSRGETAEGKEVYVLDTLGELARFYAVARAAFIGGSLVPFGGHNPLEAIAQEIPCCWGPHLFNFREIESELLETENCRKILSERELADFIKRALADQFEGDKIASLSEKTAEFRRGIADRVAAALLDKIG